MANPYDKNKPLEPYSFTSGILRLNKEIRKDMLELISKHKTTIRREKKGEPSFMEVVPLDKIREILNG